MTKHWPPIPPESLDLAAAYGLHFYPGSQDEEGVSGECICLQAYHDCVDAIEVAGRALTFEEMRDAWRKLPHWTIDIADMGLRALGYHGWGCARYGMPVSPKSGAGFGDSGITHSSGSVPTNPEGCGGHNRVHGPGDPYSRNFDGCGVGDPI